MGEASRAGREVKRENAGRMPALPGCATGCLIDGDLGRDLR
jgi:hypothetical protein